LADAVSDDGVPEILPVEVVNESPLGSAGLMDQVLTGPPEFEGI
jgi:hypothetical protein